MKTAIRLYGAICAVALALVSVVASADTIKIRIGHQSMCTDTYPGGVVIKNLHLLDKYLPTTGKYKGVKYDIEWRDYSSGAPITNMMIGGKLDFGVMGDYPLVVNGAKMEPQKGSQSLLITGTAYNLDGAGNGIVVPANSNIYTFKQLKGKTISVPVGSAAWGMLYKAAQDAGMKITDFNIANQDPMSGIASIAANKIDAHADFCPMSEFMEYNGTGRMVYSGSETGIPYLHGVVVREEFAKQYPEVVVAYLKALIVADAWIAKNPEYASKMMSKWTMIPKEVLYLYYSKGGYLTPDPTLKPRWVATLEYDHDLLAKYAQLGPLDFKRWVNDSYLRTAYQQLGMNYGRQIKVLYNPTASIHLPPEIWIASQGVHTYPSLKAMLDAVQKLKADGKKINATYVYDSGSGLKLFGANAFYVGEKTGVMKAFMLRNDANRFAAAHHTSVWTYSEALAAVHTAEGQTDVSEARLASE